MDYPLACGSRRLPLAHHPFINSKAEFLFIPNHQVHPVARETSAIPFDALVAIAYGYSLRYPDDTVNLEHQCEIYGALYARCRPDVVNAEAA